MFYHPRGVCFVAHSHTTHLLQVVKHSQIVFICVKPQYVRSVLEEIRDLLTDEHVIVSIAAGVPIASLKVPVQ